MKHGTTLAAVLAAVLVAGCATTHIEKPEFAPDGTNKVQRAALVVNLTHVDPMKYSGWHGYCAGSEKDAKAVKDALDSFGVPYIALADSQATRAGVEGAARAVGEKIADGGLLMVYFSGHGGQQAAFSGEAADGMDETICLYDGRLLDDTVWAWLKDVPRGVRVWLVTDCCNSGTNFRGAPHDYANGVRAWWRHNPDLLHWGASQDGQNAVGGPDGGFFTIALRQAYEPGMTYEQWFKAAKKLVKGKQTPVANHTGKDFQKTEAWK